MKDKIRSLRIDPQVIRRVEIMDIIIRPFR